MTDEIIEIRKFEPKKENETDEGYENRKAAHGIESISFDNKKQPTNITLTNGTNIHFDYPNSLNH